MKTLRYITCLFLIMSSVTMAVKAQQTNFSGTWKLNEEKSEFGTIPVRSAVKQYQVEQGKNKILLKWVTEGEGGKVVNSELTLPVAGNLVSVVLPSQRTRSCSIAFSEEGKVLTLNKVYSKIGKATEIDYTLKEKWHLAEGGEQLLIELTSPAYTIKAVYDRDDNRIK